VLAGDYYAEISSFEMNELRRPIANTSPRWSLGMHLAHGQLHGEDWLYYYCYYCCYCQRCCFCYYSSL